MHDRIPQLTLFRDWLRRERALNLPDYAAMWSWSTTELDAFWRSAWDYFDVGPNAGDGPVVRGEMPNAVWFEGAQVNYAAHVFRHAAAADAAGQPAIIAQDETGETLEVSWSELQRRSAAFAIALKGSGVGPGDRVAAYLPNRIEAVIGLLGCASIGAIWTLCAPDMGTPAVLDRFRQTEPKALIVADGVLYGGKRLDRSAIIAELRRGLPTVETVYVVGTPYASMATPDAVDFNAIIARDDETVAAFEPARLPFEHPLWILYSSGTTGLPKAIVHGHGGIILTGCVGNLHLDLGASYSPETRGERFHWYSSTGWVMWNIQIGGLLSGTTICLFDGSPRGDGGSTGWDTLWMFAARHRVTWFGAGAAFHTACRQASLPLEDIAAATSIRALGTTGSPLDAGTQRWGTQAFAAAGKPDIWWCNISGGTDIVSAFISGNRELPPAPGRLQCRHLGAAIEAWDDAGNPLIGQVGELVCTRPFPSMPLFFWGDERRERYRATYFAQWEGIWRHGDWLVVEPDGTCVISGRSDATINRHGLRMGTADLYTAVEAIEAIEDCLVVDVEDGKGGSDLVMFVVMANGAGLDDVLIAAIGTAIRDALSPRFIPNHILAAPAIPRTLSGKKQELPIKRLFLGWPVAKVIDPNLTQNPEVLDWYVAQANKWSTHIDGARMQR